MVARTRTHPQKRSSDFVANMVEARDSRRWQAEADDWMARGWNPFLPQTGPGRRWGSATSLMAGQPSWGGWIAKHAAAWPSLAHAAFGAAPDGKLDAGPLIARAARCQPPDAMAALLGAGLSPSSRISERPEEDLPALFAARPANARLLVAAGANPLERALPALSNIGCWEHWAERAIHGREVAMEDLDWLATHCPPSWRAIAHGGIGGQVLRARDAKIAERMLGAGAGPAAFGMATPNGMEDGLMLLLRDADPAPVVKLFGDAWGWPLLIEALSRPRGAGSSPADPPSLSRPLTLAILRGRVRVLGLFERHGLLGSECLSPQKLVSGLIQSLGRQMIYNSSGLAWAIGRLRPSDPGASACAEQALRFFLALDPALAPALARACASSGTLPHSGPGSPRDIFQDGELWDSDHDPANQEFGAFEALCEAKALRQTTPCKHKAAPVPKKIRL